MTRVFVGPTRFDGRTAAVTISVGDEEFDITMASRDRRRAPELWGDVWAPVALFPAMATGLPLELADPVSSRLAQSLPQVQSILSTWFDEFTPVPFRARARRDRRRGPVVHAQSFTGGADSFFTVNRYPEITRLIYLHDLVFEGVEVDARVTALLDSASTALGKEMVHLESNVRVMLDRYGEWGEQTHGAALSAAAAFASHGPTNFRIPASFTYKQLMPRGSHPLVDPLWSSDTRRIIHDSADTERVTKVMALAHNPIAMAHLRVCWRSQTRLNCSECEKCLRTMIILEVAGALESAPTFDSPLPLHTIAALKLANTIEFNYARQGQDAARAAGRNDIVDAIQTSLEEFLAREAYTSST